MSADLLALIMEKFPSTTGIINFTYGINAKFSPEGVEWVKITRPCNVGTTQYQNKESSALEDLDEGLSELENIIKGDSPTLMDAYNKMWNNIGDQIYDFYKKKD